MSFLTGSANCVKYTLYGFNLGFMITGIILIGIGVGVTAAFVTYDDFLTSNFYSIPTFLIVIGAMILIIAFFGCWGAIKENYCLVLAFSVLLGIIFILELSAGISGYVLRNDAEGLLNTTLQDSLGEYNSSTVNGVTKLWDYVQTTFDCCGVTNYTDWSDKHDNMLPLTCCNIPNGVIGNYSCNIYIDDTQRKSEGCLARFSNYIEAHAVSLGAAGVVIAIIQFFGVIFACYIAREIKIRNGITGIM